jgi:hypothetical protein
VSAHYSTVSSSSAAHAHMGASILKLQVRHPRALRHNLLSWLVAQLGTSGTTPFL